MTGTCHRETSATYCDLLPPEIDRLARTLADLDPAARVPTCPDWSVSDLAEHIGTVHRWAMNMVKVLTPKRIPSASMDLAIPDDPAARPAWVGAGAEPLTETLRGADPDAPMWAWGSDQHARFWPRRMVHETTVHRADAEFSAGIDPVIDPSIAVDGIDEFLDNLPHARRFAPRVDELRGRGERLVFRANDADISWTISLQDRAFAWDHSSGTGTFLVDGSASDLLLLIYGRRTITETDRFTPTGDRAAFDFWAERSKL